MLINVITKGQSVIQIAGKHHNETGYVLNIYFMADSFNCGHYCRVRFRNKIGVKNVPMAGLRVARLKIKEN